MRLSSHYSLGPTNMYHVLLGNVVGGGLYGFTPITGNKHKTRFIYSRKSLQLQEFRVLLPQQQ